MAACRDDRKTKTLEDRERRDGLIASPDSWPYGDARRRSLDIDEQSDGLTLNANLFSEPDVPPGEWNWTPSYVRTPPEARGVDDASSSPPVGPAYNINGYGGGGSGTTAAHVNKIKNPDMSRGAMFWDSPGMQAPIVAPDTSDYVTGGASLSVQVDTSVSEHIYQDFWVDSGVRTVTVNVRYQLATEGVNAFRFDLYDPVSDTRLGFFSDVGPGPTDWRVRSLTGRFDGLSGGVVGPRRLRVRIYPFNGDDESIDGQEVLLDSAWLVEGGYAATYRPYSEAVEVLAADDREIFFSGTTSTTEGPTAAMPTNARPTRSRWASRFESARTRPPRTAER